MAHVELVHVPYKGLGPALTDLMGGQVQLIISTMASALPQVKAGKLRPLAVTTAKRYAFFPGSADDGRGRRAWLRIQYVVRDAGDRREHRGQSLNA